MDGKLKQFVTLFFLNKSEKQGEGVTHFTTIMKKHQEGWKTHFPELHTIYEKGLRPEAVDLRFKLL